MQAPVRSLLAKPRALRAPAAGLAAALSPARLSREQARAAEEASPAAFMEGAGAGDCGGWRSRLCASSRRMDGGAAGGRVLARWRGSRRRRLGDDSRRGRRWRGRIGDGLSRRDAVEGRPEIGEDGDDGQRGERRPQPTPDGGLVLCGDRKNIDPLRRHLLSHRRDARLREKSCDLRRNTRRNGAARRQEANDFRQSVSERGCDDALREAEPTCDPGDGTCAQRPFDLAGGGGIHIRMADPRGDLRSEARGFELVEKTAQASRRGRDHRDDFADKQSSGSAKAKATG